MNPLDDAEILLVSKVEEIVRIDVNDILVTQAEQGVQGIPGATGSTGAKGDKGDPGDTVSIAIKDEGSLITSNPAAINFIGASVSASNNAGTIDVVVSGFAGYTHTQSVASDTWVILHNLGSYPSVTIIDSAGDEVEGELKYISGNEIHLLFSASFGGIAYLN